MFSSRGSFLTNAMYHHRETIESNKHTMIRGSRKFRQEGSNSYNVMSGERIQISLKAGHHRPASGTPFKWPFAGGRCLPNIECWLVSFVIFQGLRTSIAKKPCSIVIFQKGGDPDPNPLWIRVCYRSYIPMILNEYSIVDHCRVGRSLKAMF